MWVATHSECTHHSKHLMSSIVFIQRALSLSVTPYRVRISCWVITVYCTPKPSVKVCNFSKNQVLCNIVNNHNTFRQCYYNLSHYWFINRLYICNWLRNFTQFSVISLSIVWIAFDATKIRRMKRVSSEKVVYLWELTSLDFCGFFWFHLYL